MEELKNDDAKRILNCCTSIETLMALDKRAVQDLKNNTHNIEQHEVLTVIREFIRCKNDLETVKNNSIPKSKVEEVIEETKNEKLNYSEDEWYLEDEIKGYSIEKLQSLLGKE